MLAQRSRARLDVDLENLARLGEAFGEPTRVRIYGLLATGAEPRSAGELARELGLHRTVVRSHLERLVELGFLSSGVRRTGRGGRPAKIYAVTPHAVRSDRRHQWLTDAVLTILRELEQEGDVAASDLRASLELAGEEYGTALRESLVLSVVTDGTAFEDAAEEATTLAVHRAALAWLAAAGYEPLPGPEGLPDIALNACGFRDSRDRHGDVVCAFDEGLLRGLFGAAGELRLTAGAGQGSCRLEPEPIAEEEPVLVAEVGARA